MTEQTKELLILTWKITAFYALVLTLAYATCNQSETMKKKEATKIFTEDILPGIRTKELRASGVRSYKDGVYVDPELRCDAWNLFIWKLDQAGVVKPNCWHEHWEAPACCYRHAEQKKLKYYTKAGML